MICDAFELLMSKDLFLKICVLLVAGNRDIDRRNPAVPASLLRCVGATEGTKSVLMNCVIKAFVTPL